MLSESWEAHRHDKSMRANLFKDLSRIILSLGKIPLPRIGSFTLDNAGVLGLTNRPLTLRLQEVENGGIPTSITREKTYTTVEPYMSDLLGYHDSRLRYQPNAINDEADCRAQMAAHTGMRAVMRHFIDYDHRDGPFLFTLTDLHQSNIYVDHQWHVKRLIDLEWACSLPMQMQVPPWWLTSEGVDCLVGEPLAKFNEVREEFMEAFQREEKLRGVRDDLPRTRAMRRTWETGSFFYYHALDSTIGLFNIWAQSILPKFTSESCFKAESNRIAAQYWCTDADQFVAAKIKDREVYEEQLRAMFDAQNHVAVP